MTSRRTLRLLLWAMSQRRTFYVLGAGTSYGLIPVTQQMRSFIEAEYHSVGTYPVTPAAPSPLFERVLGDIPPDGRDFKRMLIRNMPLGALDFLVQRTLWRPVGGVVPPQYAVFDVLGWPATLFNFNLDGLASFYCSRKHVVLEPHGGIDRFWFESARYGELLEATAVFDVVLPHLTPKLLPSPEPTYVTATHSYLLARRLFALAPAAVVIGYSFGRTAAGGFDDAESLEYFVDLLRTCPRATFVLSPTPEELAEILRQRLSSYRVFGVPVRWEVFAGLIMTVSHPVHGLPSRWCDEQLDGLMYSYAKAVDSRYAA